MLQPRMCDLELDFAAAMSKMELNGEDLRKQGFEAGYRDGWIAAVTRWRVRPGRGTAADAPLVLSEVQATASSAAQLIPDATWPVQQPPAERPASTNPPAAGAVLPSPSEAAATSAEAGNAHVAIAALLRFYACHRPDLADEGKVKSLLRKAGIRLWVMLAERYGVDKVTDVLVDAGIELPVYHDDAAVAQLARDIIAERRRRQRLAGADTPSGCSGAGPSAAELARTALDRVHAALRQNRTATVPDGLQSLDTCAPPLLIPAATTPTALRVAAAAAASSTSAAKPTGSAATASPSYSDAPIVPTAAITPEQAAPPERPTADAVEMAPAQLQACACCTDLAPAQQLRHVTALIAFYKTSRPDFANSAKASSLFEKAGFRLWAMLADRYGADCVIDVAIEFDLEFPDPAHHDDEVVNGVTRQILQRRRYLARAQAAPRDEANTMPAAEVVGTAVNRIRAALRTRHSLAAKPTAVSTDKRSPSAGLAVADVTVH